MDYRALALEHIEKAVECCNKIQNAEQAQSAMHALKVIEQEIFDQFITDEIDYLIREV